MTGLFIGGAVFLGAAVLSGAAQAQYSQSPLLAGQPHSGELLSSHPTLYDNSHADCLLLQTVPGQDYTVTLRSSDFDSYLLISPEGCTLSKETLHNDDFEQGGYDARIVFTAETSAYGVFVNTYGAGETGRYTLSVEGEAAAPVALTTDTPFGEDAVGAEWGEPTDIATWIDGPSSSGGEGAQASGAALIVGQTRSGELMSSHNTLGDGSHVECLQLQTVQGEDYTVTLRSPDFDSYLMAAPGACWAADAVHTNDDFEQGGYDARIVFTASAAHYAVYVNSYGAGETGRYALSVEGGAGW